MATTALALAGVDTFRNQIIHCKAETLLKSLPSDSIDTILTSPPYDNLRTYEGFEWDFEYIAHQSYRVLKPGGVMVWVVGDATINGSETLTSFKQAIYLVENAGFKMWDTMIWSKYLAGNYGKRYGHNFEYMFVLVKGKEPKAFNPIRRKNVKAGAIGTMGRRNKTGWQTTGKRIVQAESVLENVWYIPVGNNLTTTDKGLFGQHAAMFPENLAERHILTWTNPGDTVLDYFMGSGTTAKMARNTKRHYIGCDISQDYVNIALDRLRMPFEKRKRQPRSESLDTLPLFAGLPPGVPAEIG